jgi:Zn-dependent alcohol dehydrogenase
MFKKVNEPLITEGVELKEPPKGEILIKVVATGVCQSDVTGESGAAGNPV